MPSGVILIFPGFRSRWTIPFSCDDGLAFDELEHEAADAVGLLQSVDGADVRMVQRGQHTRLAFESCEPLRVRQEGVGDDLDGDIAT